VLSGDVLYWTRESALPAWLYWTVCALVVFLVPVLVCYLCGVLSGMVAAVLAGVGALGFPVLFYRSSRSWWLMNYYLVVPHHLPANQRALSGSKDANT
jgi:hypothetical protein